VALQKPSKNRYGFDQTFDSFRSKFSDPCRDDGCATDKVLPKIIIERAYAIRVRRHGLSPVNVGIGFGVTAPVA
jgi:hypothetical protein